ncbi:DUF1534 domain-containing protein [Pseudomonas caricapapayae]|nr:DUF1534 domain-containing protein [Pseudomonas caricapapayae]
MLKAASFIGPGTDSRANALRWHAIHDALRHSSAPHRALKVGRRVSRNAFPRWSVRNDNA